MAEGFVQVAPDSTGARIRTRRRTIGVDAVDEQYVIALPTERVTSARAYVTSPRTINRASATAQPVFTLWNGGTNLVAVRRLTCEADSVTASAALSPYLRLYRIAAAPTGGTACTKVPQDTNDTTSAGIVATSDAASDGASAATALAATPSPAGVAWQQTIPRWHTLVGYGAVPLLNLLPDDASFMQEAPLILRPSQGLMVRLEAAAAIATAGTFSLYMKCAFGEFTLP